VGSMYYELQGELDNVKETEQAICNQRILRQRETLMLDGPVGGVQDDQNIRQDYNGAQTSE